VSPVTDFGVSAFEVPIHRRLPGAGDTLLPYGFMLAVFRHSEFRGTAHSCPDGRDRNVAPTNLVRRGIGECPALQAAFFDVVEEAAGEDDASLAWC